MPMSGTASADHGDIEAKLGDGPATHPAVRLVVMLPGALVKQHDDQQAQQRKRMLRHAE